MFTTVILMIILVSGGVYMSLQLFSLIKSLAEKIDELTKEVKNISKSGGGTDNTKQPEGDTDDKNVPPPPHSRDLASIGDPKKTITGITTPLHIYITNDGKVFITGWGDGHVHIFDKDGNFQKKFKPPTADLFGVCGKGDQVYVGSLSGQKVYEYTIDGKLIGDKLSVPHPLGVAVDSDGKFYVSHSAYSTGKIHVFNPDGSKSFDMSGIGTNPRKIQFDSDGNIRVTDYPTGTVYVVSKSGTVLSKLKIEGVNYGEGLYVDSDDNMYVCNRGTDPVYICDKNGKQIKVIKGFKSAGDASIAPDGTLWITDYYGDTVYLY